MPLLAVVYVRDADELERFQEADHGGRVVGIYRFPKRDVKLCRGFQGGCRHTAWTRHRLGHYVHACGLRNPQWWRQIAGTFLDKFGFNLLPRDETPALFRNPAGLDPSEEDRQRLLSQ